MVDIVVVDIVVVVVVVVVGARVAVERHTVRLRNFTGLNSATLVDVVLGARRRTTRDGRKKTMVKTRARRASTRETTDRRDGVDEGGVGNATGFHRDGDVDGDVADDDDDARARGDRTAAARCSDANAPSGVARARSSDDDGRARDGAGTPSAARETRDAWRESSYHPKRAFGGETEEAWSNAWESVSRVVPMAREHFERVRDDGFHGGDAREILLRCRSSDNEPYDAEDVDAMLGDLKELGKTVNAPFCCARGAVELKRLARLESWRRWRRGRHEARGFSFLKYAQTSDVLHVYGGADFGFGECEVGVYVSVANGDIAEWHRDVGDNATIQITGSKKWEVEDCMLDATRAHQERVTWRSDGFIRQFVGELAGMSRNASLEDARTCGVDHFAQPETLPRAHPIDFGAPPPERYVALGHRMRSVLRERVVNAGDTICVPRGRFHRVTPVGEEVSVSVDLRMTNIERGEWRAEAAYLREFMLAGLWGDARDAVKKLDERPFGEFPQMLATPIRWLPFEEEFSDGLVLGARLEYIVGAVDNAYDRRDTLKTYLAMPKRFHDSDDTVRRLEDDGKTLGPDVYRRDGTITPAVFFNPVCTCSITDSSEHPDYDVLNIKAASALTNKDLMNEFNIYIRKGSMWENERAALQNPIAFYCSEMDSNCYNGSTRTSCDSCAGGTKPGDGSDGDHIDHLCDGDSKTTRVTDAFASLREVLVDANILVEDVTGSSVVGLFWKSLATRHFANPRDVGILNDDPVDIDIGNAPVPRVRYGMVCSFRRDFVRSEHERLFDIPKWYKQLCEEDKHVKEVVSSYYDSIESYYASVADDW